MYRLAIHFVVIKTFRHKGLERFFREGSKAGIQPQHAKRLRLQLARLDAADGPKDMNLPGWKWHPLKGDLAQEPPHVALYRTDADLEGDVAQEGLEHREGELRLRVHADGADRARRADVGETGLERISDADGLEDNVGAAGLRLTPEDLAELG